jgi:DNA-binding CsgD family transcriptional regulator
VTHPLLEAIAPLLEQIDATVVAPDELREGDVPLIWEGEPVAGVRLGAETPRAPAGDLRSLVDGVAAELGGPLATLSRAEKQRAVRMLEERGAFTYRRSVETLAEALGVSRFTVYNYLNRLRDE